MNSRDKIIAFMQGKQDLFDSVGIRRPRYMNKKVANKIKKWSIEICNKIWGVMKYYIISQYENGLPVNVCPFCLKYDFKLRRSDACKNCEYKNCFNNNKKCVDENSNFKKLINRIAKEYKVSINLFTNRFYRNLIIEIEKED